MLLEVAPVARPLTLRSAYRQLLRVPLTTRLAVGLLGPLAAVGAGGVTPMPAAAWLAVWLLGTAVVTDVLWRRIVNWVTGPALLVVVVVQLAGLARPDLVARIGLPDATTALPGFGLCLGLMLGLYFAFHGGEGDVKLVALLGAVVGPYAGVEIAVAGYVLAAVAAALLIAGRAARRAFGHTPAGPLTAGTLPMAPFFAAAAFLFPPTFGGP